MSKVIDFNDDTIYFAKVFPDVEEDPKQRDKNAIIPSKRGEDGWYDLYARFTEPSIIIPPHTTVKVPTGIASAFSPKYRIKLNPRGSNTKYDTILNAGCIDSGYRGEYFVALVNTSDRVVVISKHVKDVEVFFGGWVVLFPYSKAICQIGVELAPPVETKEISYDELKQFESERGDGKLGSSKK